MSKKEEYRAFLNSNYNMKSKITLAEYLKCNDGMEDIYSLDEETNEEYFATLDKDDIDDLTEIEKNYKVIKIYRTSILIYIGKE